MIKVELGKEKTNGSEYPCIMIDETTDLVVLFTESRVGTVLASDEHWDMGYYCRDWGQGCFKPYNKKVVLYND